MWQNDTLFLEIYDILYTYHYLHASRDGNLLFAVDLILKIVVDIDFCSVSSKYGDVSSFSKCISFVFSFLLFSSNRYFKAAILVFFFRMPFHFHVDRTLISSWKWRNDCWHFSKIKLFNSPNLHQLLF